MVYSATLHSHDEWIGTDVMAPSLDDYDLVRDLGAGPLCRVFEARRRADGLRCVVKLLRPDLTDDPTAIKFMQREARCGLVVRHPHVVDILEVCVTRPPYFLVMELLDGESLRGRLAREFSIPVRDCVWLARQFGEGLNALHRAGFVHSDVKPDNIWLQPGGNAKLIDLGFAHRPGEMVDLTRQGYICGTPGYMAPELCEEGAETDDATDWYSFGSVLFEMLAGEPWTNDDQSRDTLDELSEIIPERLTSLLESLLGPPSLRPIGPLILQELIALEIATLRRRAA